MSFDNVSQLHMAVQVIGAFFLGAVIGWERERNGRAAGIRTFGAIALGACVFGLISIHGLDAYGLYVIDPTRIASNVVVGVGFLGAGIIFHRENHQTYGLTTAAMLWATAAVGLCVAFQMYLIACLVTLIMLLVLLFSKMAWWKWISSKRF